MDDGYNREASRELVNLRPALKFLRPYVKQVLLAGVALVVTAGVTLSIGQGLRLVIDQGLRGGSGELLEQSILVFSVLVLGLTIGTFVRFYFVSWIGERVSADIRLAVFRRLIRLHPAFFEKNLPDRDPVAHHHGYDPAADGDRLLGVHCPAQHRSCSSAACVLLVVTDPKLSLVVFISVPFVVAPIVLFGRRVRRLSRSSQDTLADVGAYAGESLRHVKVVQSFNHEARDEVEFDARVHTALKVGISRIRQRAVLIALVMLLVMSAIAVMLWVGGQDVVIGRSSAGDLAAFLFYSIIVAGSVGAISEVYSDLQRAAGATERLVELLDAPNDLPELEQAKTLRRREHLVLKAEKLRFAYPMRPEMQVLQGIDFEIAPGEMVALVGPSGAGKSTLFDLLQRFYDPTGGAIRLDGHLLTDLRLQDVRDAVGLVPQDAVLFAGTLRSNVLYGNPDATDAELDNALRLAHAAEFIAKLPDGLDSLVGESGVGLSGGEKQRLAIARALLTRPAILLLDEATSALDAESENYIRMSIEELKGQCSILVIAHRLSTVRRADRILVLEAGQLIADGPHDALVCSNELYARFARLQFDGAALAGSAAG